MKLTNIGHMDAWRGFRAAGILFLCGALVWAQAPVPPPVAQPGPQGQAAQILTAQQLDNLVAPIALYPDPLLGQVLAASTYPLEVVEAEQWLERNRGLNKAQLMDGAKQQNWDPSVQALVAFPDVLTMLNRDIQWTTDLGNAYLAQQNDVTAAIQNMRLRAEQNGKLASTPQQTVTTQTQNGQSAIVIEPANPQVIYVPVYNPQYVWGPPLWGYYPPLWYPGVGLGFGFGPGIFLGAFFPGWGGWGWGGWPVGWGWGLGWFGGGIFVNNFFFNHYGFHGFYNGGVFRGGFPAGGRQGWQHDPFHRAGVGYGNHAVAARYNNARFAAGRMNNGVASGANGARSFSGNGARGFNGASAARGFAPSNRAGAANLNRGFSGQRFNSPSAGRNFSGQSFSHSYSAPSQNRSFAGQANRGFSGSGFGGAAHTYSAPRSFGGFGGGGRSFSAPRSFGGFGGGHSFGGGGHFGGFGGGGHSFGGGGGHFGGGGHGGRR